MENWRYQNNFSIQILLIVNLKVHMSKIINPCDNVQNENIEDYRM